MSKAITRAAHRAGVDPAGLATHTGRRTTVTALYAEAGLDLSDIARYVGHVAETTTAGYIRTSVNVPRRRRPRRPRSSTRPLNADLTA